jgi:hypothetical protein
MLTEMHGKGGRLCEQAASGQMRCPLLVRSTSEDVITGELVQVMRTINPRWWLADFLNTALGATRFHQQVYRGLRIEPWVNHCPYPEELRRTEEVPGGSVDPKHPRGPAPLRLFRRQGAV